jgi:hypothetical protein
VVHRELLVEVFESLTVGHWTGAKVVARCIFFTLRNAGRSQCVFHSGKCFVILIY